jgi:hypothetical protein
MQSDIDIDIGLYSHIGTFLTYVQCITIVDTGSVRVGRVSLVLCWLILVIYV